MKKNIIIFILSFCFMLGIANAQSQKLNKKVKPKVLDIETIKPLNEVMIYCNTKDFVNNMVHNVYHLNIAAKGLVNDDQHTQLMETQLWMNPDNNQWAIIFLYKDINRSCVVGGNNIKLYSP